MSKKLPKTYSVLVDDNFHYRDEARRYELGDFPKWDEAVGAAKKVVDDYLLAEYKPGVTASSLYSSYVSFGKDPFIIPSPSKKTSFSAWDYAKMRCGEICLPLDAVPTPCLHGEGCYVDKDGNLSDQALHDEIMEGVDDTEITKWARRQLKGTLTKSELDAILPLRK